MTDDKQIQWLKELMTEDKLIEGLKKLRKEIEDWYNDGTLDVCYYEMCRLQIDKMLEELDPDYSP